LKDLDKLELNKDAQKMEQDFKKNLFGNLKKEKEKAKPSFWGMAGKIADVLQTKVDEE
jgi:hypothetical protein